LQAERTAREEQDKIEQEEAEKAEAARLEKEKEMVYFKVCIRNEFKYF
jgi:hypothetical protein